MFFIKYLKNMFFDVSYFEFYVFYIYTVIHIDVVIQCICNMHLSGYTVRASVMRVQVVILCMCCAHISGYTVRLNVGGHTMHLKVGGYTGPLHGSFAMPLLNGYAVPLQQHCLGDYIVCLLCRISIAL